MSGNDDVQLNDLEIDGFLEAVFNKYGYDFRNYSRAHIKRRILQRLSLSRIGNLQLLQRKMLNDAVFAELLLKDFSINVTEMFRDPDFFKSVRENVVPILKTWSYIKIWHAGCSTGEEVYSMAILLKEEGLYERTQIYATDFNQEALKRAKEGIYAADNIRNYTQNYQQSGAKAAFSDYYHARYESAIMDASLKKNIVWADHNLVTDSDFAEVHMVVCRNVLIYFNKDLQNKVHHLFFNSLINGGVLCLGRKESLRFSDFEGRYAVLDSRQQVYKKKYFVG